jgi:SnoaL-like domain
MPWSEQFIDAFNTHQVEPMQAICSPDIKWEDVSGHIEFEGHDGVKSMVEITLMAVPDCKFTHHGGMQNGNHYMVDGPCRAPRLTSSSPVAAPLSARPTTGAAFCTIVNIGIPGPSR